jgi:hypothetical protein
MCISGAAEVLNVPPSTLKSKMKKPGTRKEDVELKDDHLFSIRN